MKITYKLSLIGSLLLLASCETIMPPDWRSMEAFKESIGVSERQEKEKEKEKALGGNYSLGMTYFKNGELIEAIKQLEPLAKNGHAKAQRAMGDIFYYGLRYGLPDGTVLTISRRASIGEKRNIIKKVYTNATKAAKWYTLAAEHGDNYAMYQLGIQYYDGDGVIQYYPAAHMWLNIASSLGNKKAGNKRDSLERWLKGDWLAFSNKLANKCQRNNYKNCAPADNYSITPLQEYALNRVDDYYAHLSNKSYYSKMNISQLKQPAVQGDKDAQYYLGTSYEKGKGTLKDMKEALKWYKASAKSNHVFALHRLGKIYSKGLGGINIDYLKSSKYFQLAASLGYRDSMLALGRLAEDGRLSLTNEKKIVAYMWHNLANATSYYFASTDGLVIDDFTLSARRRGFLSDDFSRSQMKKGQDLSYKCIINKFQNCM